MKMKAGDFPVEIRICTAPGARLDAETRAGLHQLVVAVLRGIDHLPCRNGHLVLPMHHRRWPISRRDFTRSVEA